MTFTSKTIWLLACTAVPAFCHSSETHLHEEMVITGARMETPLTLDTNPRMPRQPLPAQDGADYLKSIPGFSVVRKGGTGGDPIFRGMGGSRLSLLMDGNVILGGCNSRMDPPTAYVFPEAYDRIRLIKGPQTVLYGPGNSAGVVLFEREPPSREPGWQFYSSALVGSFGRDDEILDLRANTEMFFARGAATRSQQDDYYDGDGNRVHSQYKRWNTDMTLGWMPSEHVTVELNRSLSNAEAAYADRGMDGSRFERDSLGFKLVAEHLTPSWKKLEVQLFDNQVDHVMDNYSLRQPEGMMAVPMASNRGRDTEGGRILATFTPTASAELTIGADAQANEHTDRTTMNQTMMPYQIMPRLQDAQRQQAGVFGEWTQALTANQRIIGGLRLDHWEVEDQRETISLGMNKVANPTAQVTREDDLYSGFMRYEKDLARMPATLYAGVGRTERFPDYWELVSVESFDSVSAFNARPETTTQLDTGITYQTETFKSSVAFFYNQIDDYLLIQSGVVKPAGMMGSRTTSISRNIDARTWGMEADFTYALTDRWRLEASATSVRGTNETDDTPLAQLSPMEFRTGLYYSRPTWSAGAFWRRALDQHRVDIGKGNIAGQDIGPSEGFNVISLNFGWRPLPELRVTSGIDNLFDETYSEHISRAGAAILGYEQTARVNEPGRTLWLKAQLTFN